MYQFILDGSLFLTNQPKDWQEIKRKVKRDSLTKSLVIGYTSRLTFVGDGYDYLIGRIASEGMCGTSTIEINSPSDNIYISGIIRYADAVVNLTSCTIECVVEDDNYYARVQRLRKYKVEIDSGKTLDGSAIADINFDFTALVQGAIQTDSGTSQYDNQIMAFDLLPGPTVDVWDWKGYQVYETFRYILSVISNDQIAFQSDFFSSDTYAPAAYNIEITGTIAAADTISWSFTNRWGVVVTGSFVTTSTSIATATIALIASFQMGSTSNEAIIDYADYKGDGMMAAFPNEPNTDELIVVYPFDISDLTVTSTNVNTIFTITEINSRSYGAGLLCLTTGKELVYHDGKPILSISFDDLFNGLDKFFNLTAWFYKDATGAQFCRIEPSSYFFDEAVTVATPNVQPALYKFISEWGWKNYNYGTGYGGTSFGLQAAASYTTDDCSDSDRDGQSEFICDLFNMLDYRFQTNMDETQIQLFDLFPGSPLTVLGYPITSAFSGVTIDRSFTSALVCNHMEAANAWGFWGVTEATYKGDRVLTIDKQILVNKEWTLKGNLTCAEIDAMVDNPFGRVSFTHFGNTYEGYVGDIEHNIYTGTTTIKLLTE